MHSYFQYQPHTGSYIIQGIDFKWYIHMMISFLINGPELKQPDVLVVRAHSTHDTSHASSTSISGIVTILQTTIQKT